MQSKRNGNERTVMMSPLRLLAALLLSAGALVMGADASPDQLRDQGFEALKAAQADESKIVDAARLLAQAAEAYEKAGNENAATELNSYLYWCKKKMTLQQMDTFIAKGNGVAKAAVAKMEAVEKKVVKPEEAALWLAKADGFAEASKDPFLSAVRYFEVASRFKGTPEGDQALEKSLNTLQKSRAQQEETASIVGKWKWGPNIVTEFTSDGRMSKPGDYGTWKKDGSGYSVMWRSGWINRVKIEDGMMIGNGDQTDNGISKGKTFGPVQRVK